MAKLSKADERKLSAAYHITSICREDLLNDVVGFSKSKVLKITDQQMEVIAAKMEREYVEQLFWDSLRTIAEDVIKEEK